LGTRNRWDSDFTIQTNTNLASEYLASVAPFFLGSRGGVKNIFLRQIVEAIVANNIWNVTDIDHTDSTYAVLSSDFVLLVDSSTSAVTIDLPTTVTAGRVMVIKDRAGSAATNNIIIQRNAALGSETIDDMTSITMQVDFGAVALISGNGSEWHSIMLI
jgi:hypothetical protein